MVIFTLFFFFCGIFSAFSQEGRFHITGDDVNSQLQWIDLENGNQFFSLVGVSAIRTGPPGVYYTIHNSNKYRVTVTWKCYAFPYSGRQNVVNSRNVISSKNSK
jgi:hypothetical protein